MSNSSWYQTGSCCGKDDILEMYAAGFGAEKIRWERFRSIRMEFRIIKSKVAWGIKMLNYTSAIKVLGDFLRTEEHWSV